MSVGTRAEIVAELDQLGSDRAIQGKPDAAALIARALNAVEAGAERVTLRHAVYVVAETEAELWEWTRYFDLTGGEVSRD